MPQKNVLILTTWRDATADRIVEALQEREAAVFRCDPSDLPQRLSMTAELNGRWTGSLRLMRRRLALDEVHCAYYRKPKQFRFPSTMTAEDRTWSAKQARFGLGGVLSCLPRWLNHPAAIGEAEYKPVQLAAAAAVGLRTPRTIITNEPAEARAFAARVGPVIHKSLAAPRVLTADGYRFLYTTLVPEESLDHPGIALTMHLFQERVDKQYEIRLTVVDGEMFPVRIDAQSQLTRQDWRTDLGSVRHSATELPDEVAEPIRMLVRRLDLRFGAIDLIVTPEGEYVFLEINPNGNWSWLEDETGLPIGAAIADALIRDRPP